MAPDVLVSDLAGALRFQRLNIATQGSNEWLIALPPLRQPTNSVPAVGQDFEISIQWST
jgi:hypothetical protein